MNMTNTKIIAVIGATGATAGGLARAILDDPTGGFACRAVTRHPDSPAARALAERGAEVVTADLDDEASLVRAFAGAYGAFCMTSFFEHFSAEQEALQATHLAHAAAAAGVRHAVWSTAEDTRRWYPLGEDRMPTLQNRFKVPQWDAKAEGDAAFQSAGVPTTYLLTPFHWEAFVLGQGKPRRGEDGTLTLAIPLSDAKLPGIAAEDIGRCAYGIFQAGTRLVGSTLGIASDHLTGPELAAGLSTILGEPVHYQHVPADVLRSFPLPGADLAGNMFQFVTEQNDAYCASRDADVARSLDPRLVTFADWVDSTRRAMPVPAQAH
jgi:uncharacterized protein YbjT (DUF2867 family)